MSIRRETSAEYIRRLARIIEDASGIPCEPEETPAARALRLAYGGAYTPRHAIAAPSAVDRPVPGPTGPEGVQSR